MEASRTSILLPFGWSVTIGTTSLVVQDVLRSMDSVKFTTKLSLVCFVLGVKTDYMMCLHCSNGFRHYLCRGNHLRRLLILSAFTLMSRQDAIPACQNQQYKSFGRKGEDARDDAAKERVKAHAKRTLINIFLTQRVTTMMKTRS